MVVQVNGKVRDRIEVDPDIDEAEAERLALASEKVQAHLDGATRARSSPARPSWSTSSFREDCACQWCHAVVRRCRQRPVPKRCALSGIGL